MSPTASTADDIREQLSALQQELPEPVQRAIDFLQVQYEAILGNPNVQEAAAQLQQWQQQAQATFDRLPEPIRDGLVRSIPGVGTIATAIQLKQAWDELPEWTQDLVISLAPLGDAVDLVREAYNGAAGREVDKIAVTLSVIGLAGDLGWLDGIIPDPIDAVNGGAALLKAAYKQMNPAAREALGNLLEKAGKSADNLATFAKRLGDLVPNTEKLLQHPNALPRLFDLSDAAFHNAMKSPQALKEAIRRVEFADNFIGKKLDDLTPDELADFKQAYNIRTVDGGKVVQRKSIDDGYTQVTLDENGVIQPGAGRVSDRLSNPSRTRGNYERAYGDIPRGHQVHHLIPDSVVRDRDLTRLAREKAGYDLDDASNLLALPYTREALEESSARFIHKGSHPGWSEYVEEQLDNATEQLKQQYEGTLDNVPPDTLRATLESLEDKFRDVLGNGSIEKLRDLKVIDEDYILEGQKVIRLSQNEPLLTPDAPIQTASITQNDIAGAEIVRFLGVPDDGYDRTSTHLSENLPGFRDLSIQAQHQEIARFMIKEDMPREAIATVLHQGLSTDVSQETIDYIVAIIDGAQYEESQSQRNVLEV